MNQLFILHADANTGLNNIQVFLDQLKPDQYIEFKTCLRSLIFISESDLSHTQIKCLTDMNEHHQIEIYKDEKALNFLMQLLSGLKSRIIGETEIFGQFKKMTEALSSEQKQKFLHPTLIKFLFESVKEIREKHIKTWGVKSYGSMIRKIVKPFESIDLIGFGHLAQEIKPWIESKPLSIFVRNPEKILKEAEFLQNQKILKMDEKSFSSEVLILAAPMSTQEVIAKIENSNHQIKCIIDCRALDLDLPVVKSYSEKISSLKRLFPVEVIELQDLFKSLEAEQLQLSEKMNQVKDLISEKVLKFSLRESHRPLGWDDLCL